MKLYELIEGPHDPHTKKAVFMLGGPGSGKTYIAKRLFGSTGLRPVNVDQFYEMLTQKHNITGAGFSDELYKYSGNLSQKRLDKFLEGHLGVIIDGTGRKVDRINRIKTRLEGLGYETLGVYVNTDLETALNRNEQRRRKIPPNALRQMHKEVQAKLGHLQQLFKSNMLFIDNSEDNTDLNYANKQVQRFLNEGYVREGYEPEIMRTMVNYQEPEVVFAEAAEWAVDYIKKNCQPWLAESNSGRDFFYRGHERLTKAPLIFLKSVRKDRQPKDSSEGLHAFMNELVEICGKKANRSNSIFVTANQMRAETYGSTYIVLPIGQFNYTWHADYGDWTSEMHAIISNVLVPASEIKLPSDQQEYIKTVAHDHYMADPSKPYESYVDKLTKQAQEQKRNQLDRTYGDLEKYVSPERVKNNFCPGLHIDYLLEKAFNRGNEVMIKCNSYIAIQPTFYFSYILDHI